MKRSVRTYVAVAVVLMGVGSAGAVLADECNQKCVITINFDGPDTASCGTVEPGETGAKVCVPINTGEDAPYCETELCEDTFGYPIA